MPDKRKRYRDDPEFRARNLQYAKDWYQKHKDHPVHMKLIYIRKSLWNHRNSVELHMEKAAIHERAIMKLLPVKEGLEKQLRKERGLKKT
jgi:hypothetical protein